MALSVDQFGKALVSAGLFTADELKALWNAIPADQRPKDGDAFAQRLVELKKLNDYQAKELLEGRGARLVMGEYTLLAKIGEGGMGQVFKAQHRRMNRVVALKVMSAAAMKDEAAIKRFQREVHAAARLEHPNIVTAYDSGEAGNVKYLVMQFVDGGDLSDLVKKKGPLEIQRAVDYVLQAARGLSFAHGEGVVHRDIKPANLLLDKKGVVKILDMGLARIEGGDGLTATEQVMGTVDYMSPEQAANTKTADGRSDIYSLGCTLWFLLTAKKLYDGDSMISRLMSHRTDPLPSLVKTRDDAPWSLEQSLHKMIAKVPQDRFQTMDDVVAALEPFAPSGGSRSGIGSSIGTGPQNAEMASFLKSVGPAVKQQTKPAPSKTNAEVEATAQFTAAGADTDPKSAIHPPSKKAAQPQAKGSGGKSPPKNKNLILAGAGGAALLILLGAWFIFRDKDGNETARVQLPEGGSVQIQPQPKRPGPTGTASNAPTTTSPARVPTGSYFSSTSGNAPPPGDYALLFDGDDSVEFYDPVPYSPNASTIEAYVRPDAVTKDAFVCSISERGNIGTSFTDGTRWVIDHYREPAGHHHAESKQPLEIGKRIHLAGVFDKTAFRLYADGKLIAKTGSTVGIPFIAGNSVPYIGRFFRGLIDEVRISKSARYDGDFTPLARFEADADTLALYHFNEGAGYDVPDSSGNSRHGLVKGAMWVKADGSSIPPTTTPSPTTIASPSNTAPPSSGNYALQFSEVSQVEFVQPNLDRRRPFTIEAFVTYPTDSKNQSFAWLVNIPNQVTVQIYTTGNGGVHVTAPYNGGKSLISAVAPLPKGRRVHVAAVRSAQEIRLYYDGKLTKATPTGMEFALFDSEVIAWLGGGSGGGFFDGTLDEIRISQAERYTADFTPAPRHEPDADTLVLFHCDEGSGKVLKDSSGKGRDGRIVAANWIKSDAPPNSSPQSSPSGDWNELFNGRDTAGWTVLGRPGGWSVNSGVLVGQTDAPRGWLMSDDEYGDFELELEYKLAPGGNSGVFLRAWREGSESGADFHEVQLLDDGPGPHASTQPQGRNGAVFSQLAPTGAPATPPNQWHRVRVHCYGSHVRVAVNDVEVVDGELKPGGPSRGRIGLQLYPTHVEFRNLRVRPLRTDGSPIQPLVIAAKNIPAEALTFGGHRYLLVESPGIWREAKTKAEAMGGHLITINSREEGEWFSAVAVKSIAENSMDRIFIGAERPTNDDQWTWITGEPFDESLWSGARVNKLGLHLSWIQGTWDDVKLRIEGRYLAVEWDTLSSASVTPVDPPVVAPPPVAKPVGPAPPPAVAPFDAAQAKSHQAAWAKHLGTQVETVNSVGAKMVLIPPGEFLMGSTDEQVEAALKVADEIKADQYTKDRIQKAERPQHKVVITKPLLMSATEVTIGQFKKFVEASKYVTEAEQYGFGDSSAKVVDDKVTELQKQRNWRTPGYAVTDDSPVSQVTWNDACAYCNWLSEQEQRAPSYRPDGTGSWFVTAKGNGYRLPTEAEWEYACRAGTTTQYSFGDDYQELLEYGWYNVNAGGSARAVGLKAANAFGLHDMHGNLQEWCGDFYDEKWYERPSLNDPTGPVSGSNRVIRGGNWFIFASHCRSAYRSNYFSPSTRSNYYGFRCVSVW